MAEQRSFAGLDEVRALLGELPGPDLEAGAAAAERQAKLTKPAGSLGRLEELAVWLATWQGRHPPRVERPYTAVFAGNHGVAAQGVSAYPAAVTEQMVQNFIAGGAAVNQLCGLADADLRVYEMALEEPTRDFTEAPAMDEGDCVRALAYGMMAVEDGIDVLALGEMGIGNTTSAGPTGSAAGPGSTTPASRARPPWWSGRLRFTGTPQGRPRARPGATPSRCCAASAAWRSPPSSGR
jgi:nicotinate-nucleotide--dimethylbenzimidazole phosphoribosyltransferase